MTADAKTVSRRLGVLELARRLGNVSEACRRRGITRTQFYEYKKRYEILGLEGLADQPPIVKNHPQTTPRGTVAKICALALAHPSRGCNHLERLLRPEGVNVSAVTIQKILNKHALGTRENRWQVLERQYAETGVEPTEEQIAYLEKQNPAFRERHLESAKPGELVCQANWPIGYASSIGQVYLHVVVDTFNGFAFAVLVHSSHKSEAAKAVLRDQVVPFFREHGLKVENVQSDSRQMFRGSGRRSYELCLAVNHIRQSRTRATNGFVERFRQAAKREFFAPKLGAGLLAALPTIQADLEVWLHHYNNEQLYLGYPNQGQSPIERLQQYLASRPASESGPSEQVATPLAG